MNLPNSSVDSSWQKTNAYAVFVWQKVRSEMNKLRFCVFQDIRQFAVQPSRPSNFLTGKSALSWVGRKSAISFLNNRQKQAFMLLFFEDGQVMFIAPAILSLRARKKRKKKRHVFQTPPDSDRPRWPPTADRLTVCVEEGAGWMGVQGSIEVIRQRWREMHTEEAWKDTTQEEGDRDKATRYSAFGAFVHTYRVRHKLKYDLIMKH